PDLLARRAVEHAQDARVARRGRGVGALTAGAEAGGHVDALAGDEDDDRRVELVDLAVAVAVVDAPDRGRRPDVDEVGVLLRVRPPRPARHRVERAARRVVLAVGEAACVGAGGARVAGADGRQVEALALERERLGAGRAAVGATAAGAAAAGAA